MFRFGSNIKGLVIDCDSLDHDSVKFLQDLNRVLDCVFLSSKPESIEMYTKLFGQEKVLFLGEGIRNIAPSLEVQKTVLEKLRHLATDIAYLSTDVSFLCNALGFLSGTIWLRRGVTYAEAARLPDLTVSRLSDLSEILEDKCSTYTLLMIDLYHLFATNNTEEIRQNYEEAKEFNHCMTETLRS